MRASVKLAKGAQEFIGTLDENLKLFERCLQVTAHYGDTVLDIEGADSNVRRAQRLVEEYTELVEGGARINPSDVQAFLRILSDDPTATLKGLAEAGRPRTLGKKSVMPKSLNQRRYVDAIERYDMVFGIGPSGTGKTYLAVAMAVDALLSKEVSRIILARPAVPARNPSGEGPSLLAAALRRPL